MWGCMYLLKLVFLFYSGKYPGVKLLDIMVFLKVLLWCHCINFCFVFFNHILSPPAVSNLKLGMSHSHLAHSI